MKAAEPNPANKTTKKPNGAKPRHQKKVKKVSDKEPRVKRITNISSIVRLIQASTEGIPTPDLKEKTRLSERHIWSIVNRTAKEGKIRKIKRGLHGGAAAY